MNYESQDHIHQPNTESIETAIPQQDTIHLRNRNAAYKISLTNLHPVKRAHNQANNRDYAGQNRIICKAKVS